MYFCYMNTVNEYQKQSVKHVVDMTVPKERVVVKIVGKEEAEQLKKEFEAKKTKIVTK